MATRLSASATGGQEVAPLNIAAGEDGQSRGQATNLSGSQAPANASLMTQVEYFADEMVLGELEKREIMGMPINRRMSVAIVLCCCVLVAVVMVILGKTFSGGGEQQMEHAKISEASGKERYMRFQNALEPLTGGSITEDGTPEEAALRWLAYDDPHQLSTDSHIDRITQRFVLATLFFATNGDTWLHWYRFMSHHDECEWNHGDDTLVGAYCNNKNFVEKLILDNLNLTGTLPRDIGLLTHMEHLDLSNNEIHSHLPSSIGILGKLTHLDISKYLVNNTVPFIQQVLTMTISLCIRLQPIFRFCP